MLQAHKEVALASIGPVVVGLLSVATVQLRGCSCRATLHSSQITMRIKFSI